jgi:CRISPR system Cascade subunit CasD
MQSWGTDSRFDLRFTGREPSKSGVIGLLCAALGKPRVEQPGDGHPALAELAALRMGTRADRPGRVQVDYQTAGGVHRRDERYGVINAAGKQLSTVQSQRYYLADATFLVGLEGDDALLRRLDAALAGPVWQLCLGRKAFVPGEPVRLADAGPDSRWWTRPLEAALNPAAGYPWLGRDGEARPETLRLALDAPLAADTEMRMDVPLDLDTRRFGARHVRTMLLPFSEVDDVSLPPDPQST